MTPAAKVEHFDANFRLELDRLRLKVLELWGAPHLDERALSHAYAKMLVIVRRLGEEPMTGEACFSKRHELQLSVRVVDCAKIVGL